MLRETDPVRGTVPIDLDRPRNLKWTFECIRQVERLTGVNLLWPSAEDAERFNAPDLTMLTAMLHGALLHEDPRLTLEHTVRLIYEAEIGEILAKVGEAYRIGMPKRKKKPGAEATTDPPAAPESQPTGSESGQVAAST
jgi:hypothetical protein